MAKTLLIAGKELPECADFADSMALAGYNVVVAGNQNSDKSILWNRDSSISARAVVLETENRLSSLDTAVLYFDAQLYSNIFLNTTAPEKITQSLETMIAGYQYLTTEILARFAQKKTDSKLIFIVKQCSSIAEILHSPSRTGTATPAGPLTAAAQAAFIAFAENIAARTNENDNTSILLVSSQLQGEGYLKDTMIGSWLASYLDSMDKQKGKISKKQAATWVKAGSKGPGILSRIL